MILRFERRVDVTKITILAVSSLSAIFALIIFSVVFLQAGIDPLTAYKEVFSFAFFERTGLFLTIRNTTPLLLLTLAFALPARAGIWNTGAEGQFFMGATAAVGVSFAFPNLPAGVLLPLMMLGAALFGAGWSAVAGFLKSKWE